MPAAGQPAGRLDLGPIGIGDAVTYTLTYREEGDPYVWTGATVTSGIFPLGGPSEFAIDFTITTPANGTMVATLTGVKTLALGAGIYPYHITVTKGDVPVRLAGFLTVKAETQTADPAPASFDVTIEPVPDIVVNISGGVTGPAGLGGATGGGTGDIPSKNSPTDYDTSYVTRASIAADAAFTGRYAQLDGTTTFTSDGEDVLSWTDDGNIIFGDDSRINLLDGKLSRPHMGYITTSHSDDLAQSVPRWFPRGGLFGWELQDPYEVSGRRSTGWHAGDELASTTLAVAVADINVASSIEVASLGTNTGSDSAAAWTLAAPVLIQEASGPGIAVCHYTGRDYGTNELTGLTVDWATETAFDVGAIVTRATDENITIFLIHCQTDMGKGGFQARIGQLQFITTEVQSPDGYGGFYSAGKIRINATSPGPNSQRRNTFVWMPDGSSVIPGSWAEEDEGTTPMRRLTVSAMYCQTVGATVLPSATIAVDSPSGLPTSGTLTINSDAGAQTITYTGYSATAGEWYLTGCSGGTGTIANSTVVRVAKSALPVVIGAKGRIAAHDFGGADTAQMGAVGPAAEAGFQAGLDGAAPVWYRISGTEWGTGAVVRSERASGTTCFDARVTADTEPRAEVRASGAYRWGSGSATPDVSLRRSTAGQLAVRNGDDTADANLKLGRLTAKDYMTLNEITNPGGGAADEARLYARDNGAGKTQLVVVFPSGAAQVIATEP